MKRAHRFAIPTAAAMVLLCGGLSRGDTPQNVTGWYGYEAYHPFPEGHPWGLFLEKYVKRDDVVVHDLAHFARVGINYQLRGGDRITGGLAFQYNQPYDERLPPPGGERWLEQNRIFAGAGFNMDDRRLWRTETGYMLQAVGESDQDEDGRRRLNHTVRVTLVSDAPLGRTQRTDRR